MFKKDSRGNPEESKKTHIKLINKLNAETEKAQDLAIKGLISEEKLRLTIDQNTKQRKIHELEVKKFSDLEAYAKKIQRIRDTWKPIIQGSNAYRLGLSEDEGDWVQIGDDEWEFIPPSDQWLQDGAKFRRKKYIELGIRVVCHPEGPCVEIGGDKIFVGSETTSTKMDA